MERVLSSFEQHAHSLAFPPLRRESYMPHRNWQQVKETFHDALRLESGERDSFLDEACKGDIDFRIEVESLLISFADAKQFLERPIVGEFDRKNNWRLEDGQVISHYRILSPIASGGMGEVYLAEDTQLARRVAIKLLPSHFSDDRDRLRRFEHEARAVSALNHPNILTIFEFGNADGVHFLAAEFVSGETLRERLSRGRLEVDAAVEVATQIVSALKAAHEAGVVHRDIKPENIMIRDDGYVKVLDFGLAKLTEKSRPSDTSDTQIQFFSHPGLILGTAAYMSPEQARAVSIDHRSDIFSLGIVLYEMIAGKAPFSGETTADVIAAMIQADPPHIKVVVPTVPDRLDAIIAMALEKDRNNRYGSAAEMLTELKKVSQSGETPLAVSLEHQATLPLRPPLDTSSSQSYRRQFIAAGALVAVALAAAAIWKFALERKEQNLLASLRRSPLMTWDGEAGEGDTQAKFSPNGTMIAFSLTTNGQRNIWTKQVPDGKRNQTTDGKWDYYNPIWSADGQRIAFISNRDNRRAIWTAPFSGGDLTLVKEIESDTFSLLHWSKDGATIYYQEGVYLQGYNLFALDIGSKQVKQLTNFDSLMRAQFIRLSPNEGQIVYSSGPSEKLNIFVMKLGGGQPIQITKEETSDEYPVWLPDGNRIMYSSKRNGIYQTSIAYVDEQRSEQLNLDLEDTLISDVSSDGSKLLFYQSRREESDVWRIGIDDKVETRVTSDYGLELWPDVSPDGKSVVYQSTREFKHLLEGTITVRSTSDDQEVKVALNGFSPSYSPDGEKLAFLRDSGELITLWVIARNGDNERQLTTNEVGFSGFSQTPFNRVQVKDYSWSLDGRSLIYYAKEAGLWSIWEVSVDGGTPRQVSKNTNSETTLSCPLFAPDGKRIAFISRSEEKADAKRTTNLVLVEGEQTQDAFSSESAFKLIGWKQPESLVIAIPDDKPSAKPIKVKLVLVTPGRSTVDIASLDSVYFHNIRLSPDGQKIAVVTRPEAGADAIRIISTSGGGNIRMTANTNPNEYISEIAWSPDSRTIYYGKQRQTKMISMIENFK